MSDSNIYKQAAATKLRFTTPVGTCSVEDLFDLSLEQLDKTGMALRDEIEKTKSGSLLAEKRVSPKTKLAYDLVVDVITTRQEEAAAAEERVLKAQKRARLQELIAKKKEAELEQKDVDELEEMLNEL